MGSLWGHLLPGTFILGFGFWWTYALMDRYFKVIVRSALIKTHVPFQSTASFSHFEGFVKIFGSIIGIIAEYITALDPNHHFIHIGNSHHITMYLFFLINGVVDLSIHYGYPVPKDSDYLTLILATGIEALLFIFHLHGRTALDIHVHTLLIIAIIGSMIACLVESKHTNHILLPFMRTLCALLQGTWFFTVGFILYPPFSDTVMDGSHENLMLLTSLFCWQIAALMLVMSSIGICFYFKYRPILINEFLSNNQSLNTFSDIDYKSLTNEMNSMNELSEQQLTRIKSKDSVNESKYSVVNTSDEDI